MVENNLQREGRLLAALEAAMLLKVSAVTSPYSPASNGRAYACSAPNCTRQGYAGGYCNAHYLRHKSGKDMASPLRARKRDDACTACGKKTGAKGGWGLCTGHYKTTRYALIKDTMIDAMGGCCEVCSTKYPRSVYDFHHLGEKSGSPSVMINNKSLATIAKELSVCILLCANCHRIEHNNEH